MLIEDFDPEFVKIANLTSRAKGAVGANALVPRFVQKLANQQDKILDFGAGKHASHAVMLNNKGYDVTAYDFGSNVDPSVHDPDALSNKYNMVYASNVLNVQSSPQMLAMTLDQIKNVLLPGGKFIGNLPLTPRKSQEINAESLLNELLARFDSVSRIGGTKQAPVYLATNPK